MKKKLCFVILFLYGCVTPAENIHPNSISAVHLEHFQKCSPLEGSSRFSYTGGSQRLSFKSDWVSKNDNNWEVHFLDDIGRLQLGIKRTATKLRTSGRVSKKVPKMEVGPDGKLMMQGYYSGILAKELPCILNGNLPSDWLYSLVSSESDNGFVVSFENSDRIIRTKFLENKKTSRSEVCTQIRWKVLGIVPQTSSWCFERNKDVKSKITFKNHVLVWRSKIGS